jgi:molybdenum cofactor biosynthesis enzyme MoaA
MDNCYGKDLIEELIEELIIAVEALRDFLCPFCHRATVHKVFRENPDASFDEVGLHCRKCKRML